MHQHLRLGLVPEKPHPADLADREIWGILLTGCGDAGWDRLPMNASRQCRPSPTPHLQVRRAFNEPSGCWRAPSRLWLGPGPVTPGKSFVSGWSGGGSQPRELGLPPPPSPSPCQALRTQQYVTQRDPNP